MGMETGEMVADTRQGNKWLQDQVSRAECHQWLWHPASYLPYYSARQTVNVNGNLYFLTVNETKCNPHTHVENVQCKSYAQILKKYSVLSAKGACYFELLLLQNSRTENSNFKTANHTFSFPRGGEASLCKSWIKMPTLHFLQGVGGRWYLEFWSPTWLESSKSANFSFLRGRGGGGGKVALWKSNSAWKFQNFSFSGEGVKWHLEFWSPNWLESSKSICLTKTLSCSYLGHNVQLFKYQLQTTEWY